MQVLLRGEDIRDLGGKEVRGVMGVVSQDPTLFRGTIAENIGYGMRGARGWGGVDMAAIERASRQADVHQFITSLPLVRGEGSGVRSEVWGWSEV